MFYTVNNVVKEKGKLQDLMVNRGNVARVSDTIKEAEITRQPSLTIDGGRRT